MMAITATKPDLPIEDSLDVEELPEGWCLVRLPDVCAINMGQSPPGRTYNERRDGLPFFQGKADFGPLHPTARKWCSAPSKTARPGDILISIRAPVGPTNIADQTCAIGRGLSALSPLGGIPSLFILYALRLQEKALAEQGTGSTFTAITRDHLEAIRLRLPPLAEQKRIVAKVEELLARVNAGRERLARVPAILKRFRQSVLAAACSGRLTSDWRDQGIGQETELNRRQAVLREQLNYRGGDTRGGNRSANRKAGSESTEESIGIDVSNLPELPRGWIWVSLDALIAYGPQNGLYKPASDYGDGVPIVRIENYQDDFIQPRSSLLRLRASSDERSLYGLESGDLLVNRVNSPTHLGKSIVVPQSICPAVFESNMMRIRVSGAVMAEWLHMYLRSDDGRARLIADAKWAVNQASINQTDVRSTPVPIPSVDEQREAVRRTKSLLNSTERIANRVTVATSYVEKMRQGILAGAFQGDLVPTEADLARAEGRPYESASCLLARIRSARTAESSQMSRASDLGNSRNRRDGM